MEENDSKQTKFQEIIEAIKETIFSVNLELLKDLKAGKWYVCLLMLIFFVQIIGFLFDSNVSENLIV